MTDDRRDDDLLPRDLCPCLRTKTMSLNPEYRRTPWEERCQADTALFWCTVTQCEHGPDEDDAVPESCRPGRSCYEGIVDFT